MELEDLRVGMRVRFAYFGPAITCHFNGAKHRGEGVIEEIQPVGREPYVGVGKSWVFPREITEVLEAAS